MTNEELVLRIKAGETDLMDTLWAQVYRFAYKRAYKFYNTYIDRCRSFGIELEDLQQESFFAIYRAVEEYKPDRNTVFLTYAGLCLKRVFFALTKMNYDNWQANSVRSCSLSLDQPMTAEDPDLTLKDTLASSEDLETEVVERLYNESLSQSLNKAIGELRESWQDVIHTVYFIGLKPAEIARLENVSRSVVSLKCRRALASLAKMPELQAYLV